MRSFVPLTAGMSPYRRLTGLAVVLALSASACLSLACSGEGDPGGTGEVVADSACSPGEVSTLKAGVLTLGTAEPLEEPYFEEGDPFNGRGFLSSLGYELAAALGYDKSTVEWLTAGIGTGPTDSRGFDLALIPETTEPPTLRRFEVSGPYYLVPQAIVVEEGSDLVAPDSLGELKGSRLAVLRGSAGARAARQLIEPVRKPRKFGTPDSLLEAVGSGRSDVGLLGLPEALAAVDGVPGLEVTRQFSFPGGGEWSALLPKGSDLEPCVDQAIEELGEDGILQELVRQWMVDAVEVPRIG